MNVELESKVLIFKWYDAVSHGVKPNKLLVFVSFVAPRIALLLLLLFG